MFKNQSKRRKTALGLGVAAMVAAAGLPIFGSAAQADTAGNPSAITATSSATPPQTNVAPNTTPVIHLNNLTNVHVRTAATAGTNGGAEIRQCKGGVNITNNAAFVPLQGKNCIDPSVAVGTQSVYINASADATLTTVDADFKVAKGTFNFATPSGPATVQCDSANPCSIWVKQSFGPNTYFSHYEIQFDPDPGVPAQVAAPVVTLTGGGHTAHVTWTAPAAFPAITDYKIIPFVNNVAGATIDTASTATSFDIPGLADFTNYKYQVIATNSIGDSPVSADSNTVTPAPTAGSAPSASSSANQSADVVFAPLAGASSYVVSSLDVTTSTPGPQVTVAGSPAHFGPPASALIDGDNYTFTYHAVYPGGPGPESNPSAPVKIGSKSVKQNIIVTRPAGNLDIAEACSNGYTGATFSNVGGPPLTTSYTDNPTGTPADGPKFGLYPQTCDVNLGTGVLNAASTYYQASGSLNTVTVRDLRSGDQGWHVNTQLTDFAGVTPGNAFSGSCLQLTPAYNELSNTALYQQRSHAFGDATADAATTGTGTAIGGSCDTGNASQVNGATVVSAPAPTGAGGGLGMTELTGALAVNIPVATPADTYVAGLTFTVLGN